MSLSARRAWIEITQFVPITTSDVVALRKESVDRNMGASYGRTAKMVVALRKESVDRNTFLLPLVLILPKSLSARRAWIEISTGKCR